MRTRKRHAALTQIDETLPSWLPDGMRYDVPAEERLRSILRGLGKNREQSHAELECTAFRIIHLCQQIDPALFNCTALVSDRNTAPDLVRRLVHQGGVTRNRELSHWSLWPIYGAAKALLERVPRIPGTVELPFAPAQRAVSHLWDDL